MAFITSLIYLSTIFVFFFGQLFRVQTSNFSFPLIDVFIIAIFVLNIFNKIKNKNYEIKNLLLFHFLVVLYLTFILNFFRYNNGQIQPILYLFRLTFLLSFFIFPPAINLKIKNIFYLVIFSNVIFGLIQYFFWPNFTYFNSLNWDPHLYRLVSTFFDPTFTALIYLFLIIIIFLKPKFPYRKVILIISYIALALTYSRATYIALVAAFSFIAYQKKNLKIFIFSFLLVSATIFLLPRLEGEGTKLERTSSIFAKAENYRESFSVFKKSPIIGHGYNNLAQIREIKIDNSHSNTGFDSSLMTILTTTGLIGLILFILGLIKIFCQNNLITQSILISVLVHSLFANSLLYPWILLFFIFI